MNTPGVYVEKRPVLYSEKNHEEWVTAFAGLCQRGPLNQCVTVRSFSQFRKIFGGFENNMNVPYAVHSFFSNGGKCCRVVRVSNASSAARSVFVLDCGKAQESSVQGRLVFCASSCGKWANEMNVSLQTKNCATSVYITCGDEREVYENLSFDTNGLEKSVEKINSVSRLCSLQVEGHPQEIPSVYMQVFTGGADGTDSLGAGDFINALQLFSKDEGVKFINLPDVDKLSFSHRIAVEEHAVNMAAEKPECFALLDAPCGLSAEDFNFWSRHFDSSHACSYFPYVTYCAEDSSASIPPGGSVCGVLCSGHEDFLRNVNCGNVVLKNCSGLVKHNGNVSSVVNETVNSLKYVPGIGVKVWGVHTMSHESQWRHMNVVRIFDYIKCSLKEKMQWVVFENFDMSLQKKIVRTATAFLMDLWSMGMLAGKTQSEAFFVNCSDEMNTEETRSQGKIIFEAGVSIVRPVEFFKIRLKAEQNGSVVQESL